MANAVSHTVNFVIMPGGWFWTALRFSELFFRVFCVYRTRFFRPAQLSTQAIAFGVLAQLAEQLTLNQLVRGSNP